MKDECPPEAGLTRSNELILTASKKVLFMISQCAICDETYSTKDFITAKKRLCPDCAKKAPRDEPTRDEGRRTRDEGQVTKDDGRKKTGMAPSTFVPKPDNNFVQKPLVWAK